ncbi:hypothetical protein MVEN_02037900 [Mycena venus]|uniref:GST C-terminal domain-containing protein n=1 Tax=Mycena venus TaxID=2733690 RepID=A0A8H6XCR7_9AGAR|nr:hypothetical protein MVEN_02037900 [Mycena venus]
MSLPVLHIWPGQWELLSFHLPSLVACAPSSVDGTRQVQYFALHKSRPLAIWILTISDTRPASCDLTIFNHQPPKKTAWCSHVEAKLGDLTSYMLYSLPTNWEKLTGITLAYALPVPQRYYLLDYGLRQPNQKGCSSLPTLACSSPRPLPDHQEQIAQTFQREKVLQTARDCLDIYARLLGENQFVYHGRLTTLDIVLAAHILVIIKPPFPDRLLSDLLTDSYPTLVSHAERILARSLELPPPIHTSPGGHSIWSLLPSLPHNEQRTTGKK